MNSGTSAIAVRPRPARAQRSLGSRRALVLTLLVALACAIGAGYAIGNAGGPSIPAAKRAGAEEGHAAGSRAGAYRGFRSGYSRGSEATYRAAYQKALRQGSR